MNGINLDRTSLLNQMAHDEAMQFVDYIALHFAAPYISGLSLDPLTQMEYYLRGGKGLKPAPLSFEKKQRIYQRIYAVFKEKLYPMIFEALKPTLRRKYLNTETTCLINMKRPFDFSQFNKQNGSLVAAVQIKLREVTPHIFDLAQLQEEL